MQLQVKDTLALRKLAQRIKNPVEKVDNGSLPAGSPMFFYCKMCGYQSDVKPESYTDSPKRHCGPCAELVKANPDITPTSLIEMARNLPPE